MSDVQSVVFPIAAKTCNTCLHSSKHDAPTFLKCSLPEMSNYSVVQTMVCPKHVWESKMLEKYYKEFMEACKCKNHGQGCH